VQLLYVLHFPIPFKGTSEHTFMSSLMQHTMLCCIQVILWHIWRTLVI